VDDLSGIQILREQAAEPIVHRFFQILLATQVALGCQYRHMAKKKLDSLQFASIHVTKLCTGSAHKPHAACAPLCRIPDHAESLDLSCAGTPFGPLAMRHNPNAKTNPATLEA
jgi:hypothetical protein